jgi:hypothetical protein
MASSMEINEKVRENRLRRAVDRRGFTLSKTRRRDPMAWDYGLFTITDPDRNVVVAENLTVDGLEDWLSS